MPLSKTGWPSLNVVIFPPVMRLVMDDPQQWPPRRLLINSRANLGRPPDFGSINSWTTGHLKWAGCVHHSWRFGHAVALLEVDPEMPERGSKTSKLPVVWATFGIFSARSKWFPVAIGDWDKATISEWEHSCSPCPKIIPSAKIRWTISRLDFLVSRRHPPNWLSSNGPNY